MMEVSKLPIMNMDLSETNCCPKFEPESWHEMVFDLSGEPFVKVSTKSFFYIPLNMGKVMREAMQTISMNGAMPSDRYLMLSKDVSKWRCEHSILVTKPVPQMESVNLDGQYYTEVFEGDFRMLPEWMKAFKKHTDEKGYSIQEQFAFYTTCPKCAKHYGKNYVIMFGRL